MQSRIAVIAVLAAALALGAVSEAVAKAPPKGNYTCTYFTLSFGNAYGGTLNILGKGRYSVNKGKKGKFRTRGSKLSFVTGDYRKLYIGQYRRSKGGHVIGLLDPADKSEMLTCSRAKR